MESLRDGGGADTCSEMGKIWESRIEISVMPWLAASPRTGDNLVSGNRMDFWRMD